MELRDGNSIGPSSVPVKLEVDPESIPGGGVRWEETGTRANFKSRYTRLYIIELSIGVVMIH